MGTALALCGVAVTAAYQLLSRVLASTELGRGQWVMVPLHLAAGGRVWLNRGFVPEALGRRPAALPAGAPMDDALFPLLWATG